MIFFTWLLASPLATGVSYAIVGGGKPLVWSALLYTIVMLLISLREIERSAWTKILGIWSGWCVTLYFCSGFLANAEQGERYLLFPFSLVEWTILSIGLIYLLTIPPSLSHLDLHGINIRSRP